MRRVKICLISFLAVFGINFAYAQEKQALEIVTKGTSALEEQAVRSVTKTGGLKTGVLPKIQVPTVGALKNNISTMPSSLAATVEENVKRQVKKAEISRRNLPELPEEMMISVPDRMFTLWQILNLYEPNWGQYLTRHLSAQEVIAVKEAIAETDKVFFENRNGQVIFINARDWNYRAVFAQKLDRACQQRGVTLDRGQRAFLLGGSSSGNYNPFLRDCLKVVTLETFVAKEGRAPSLNKKKSQSREERSLKNLIDNLIHDGKNRQLAAQSARMLSKFARVPHTPQQTLEAYNKFIQERNGKNPSRNSQDPVEKSLAVSIQHFALAGNPEDPAVQEIQRIHQESKTQRLPQQTLDEWQQFKQEHNGEKPSRYSEDPVERSLAISMEYYARHGNLADPVVQELKRVYREGMKEYRTPQRALEEYNQFKAEHNGERPSLSSKDPFEKALAISVYNFARKSNLADPAVQELRKIYQKEFPSRATISEVFDDFLAYVREFHAYPSAKEPLYNNIRSRIRRSPQPGNPDWDKLKQLDELVRSAQRGEVPWDVFDKANPLE